VEAELHSELISALRRSGQLQASATSLPVNRGLGGAQSWSASSQSHFTASKQGVGWDPEPVWACWRKEKSLAPMRI